MINETYKARLSNQNIIREFAAFARKRGDEIGYENVYDFSLGNPSVPVCSEFTENVISMYKNEEPVRLHGYSPVLGIPEVRATIADSLKKRFGISYEEQHIFPTTGAAGALAHALRAVTKPGDAVLTFAPFFPEYTPYVNDTGARLEVVPAKTDDFQANLPEFERLLSERDDIAAVLINSPNNPSGAVYSKETLTAMADIMRTAEKRLGHELFLISDEPYREIVFDKKTCPYPAAFYENTLTCYSFSKSLSLPGERIGYVAVNPNAKGADILAPMMGQISRGIGHNCPSSTMQRAVASVIDMTSDLSVYEENMNILYDALSDLGFSMTRPGGSFYIFPKCLEEDALTFCKKALKHDLILVPSDNFGVPGYFRIAYCIDTEKVKRSLSAFEKFVKEEY